MQPLERLKEEMQLVSVEECSFWGQLPFPEEYKQVQARVRRTIEHYLQQHPDENVLFVGHALSIEYLVSLPSTYTGVTTLHDHNILSKNIFFLSFYLL